MACAVDRRPRLTPAARQDDRMRNLIPRVQVVVARDRDRAERMLSGLKPGQEVFLSPLTEALLKVSDSADADVARVLGVLSADWSDRILSTEATGRKCRAWFVGNLPNGVSEDGSYRIVLTVWCASLGGRAEWRELSVDELLAPAREGGERAGTPPQSPFGRSRLNDAGLRQTAASGATRPPAPPVPAKAPAAGTAAGQDRSGLRKDQIDLIRAAVQRKFPPKGD